MRERQARDHADAARSSSEVVVARMHDRFADDQAEIARAADALLSPLLVVADPGAAATQRVPASGPQRVPAAAS